MMDRALDCTGTVKETMQPLLSTHYMAASRRPEPQEWIRTIRQSENGTAGQRRETTVEATDQEVQQPTETQATIEQTMEKTPTSARAEENAPESQSTTSMELARFGTIAIMIIGIANTCAVATLAIGLFGFAFGMTFSASLCACVAIGIGLSKPNEKGRATQRELIHLIVAAIGIAAGDNSRRHTVWTTCDRRRHRRRIMYRLATGTGTNQTDQESTSTKHARATTVTVRLETANQAKKT